MLCTASDIHFRNNVQIKIEQTIEERTESSVIDDGETTEHVEECQQHPGLENCDVNEESKGKLN